MRLVSSGRSKPTELIVQLGSMSDQVFDVFPALLVLDFQLSSDGLTTGVKAFRKNKIPWPFVPREPAFALNMFVKSSSEIVSAPTVVMMSRFVFKNIDVEHRTRHLQTCMWAIEDSNL